MQATAPPPQAATPPKSPSQVAVDPTLIVPFATAIRGVFKTMLKVPVELGKSQVKATPAASYDVSGVVGFSGEVVGSVVVSFHKEAAIAAVAAFAGMEMEYAGGDFADAIGELTNMIAGGAKRGMNRVASITVPNVIIGPGHIIARLSGVPCIVIPCTTPLGDFAVEINVTQAPAPAAP